MQFSEQTSVEFTAGNHDTPRDQLFVQFLPIGTVHLLYPRTDERRNSLHVLPRRDDQQAVSLAQHRIRFAYLHRTVGMQYPRGDEFLAYQMGNLPDRLAEDGRIVHLHRDVGGTGQLLGCPVLRRLGFLVIIDPEHRPQQHIHQDDPDHAQRIRHRISHRNGRIVSAHILHCLLSRPQTGGIGYRSGKDTYHRGDGGSGGPKDTQSGQYAQRYDQDGKHVQAKPSTLESREKARSDLHPDGIDEEDKAELLDKAQDRGLDPHSDVGKEDPGKKHPGDPQRNTPHFDFSQEYAQGDHHRKNGHRMGDSRPEKKLVQPVHTPVF